MYDNQIEPPLEDHADSSQLVVIQNKSLMMTLNIIFQYIVSDIQKKPRSFKIGLFTIYLVVMFLSLIQSAFQLSTLIFLQLSETSAGDTDIVLVPTVVSIQTSSEEYQFGPPPSKVGIFSNISQFSSILQNIKLINTTQIEESVRQIPSIYGQSPRWLITGDLSNPDPNAIRINDKMRTFVLPLDSLHENSIGIGRTLDVNSIENDQVYVSDTALRGLNLTQGDMINLNIDLVSLIFSREPKLSNSSNTYSDQNTLIQNEIDNVIEMTIIEPLRQQYGSGVIDQPINSTELKSSVKILDKYSNKIEENPQYKNDLRTYLDKYINETYYDNPQQKTNLIQAINYTLDQNLTILSSEIKSIVDSLPINTTFTIASAILGLAPFINDAFNLTIPFKIKDSISSPRGKWTNGLGNVIAVDYKNLTDILIEAFRNNLVKLVDLSANAINNTQTESAKIAKLLLINPILDPLVNYSRSFNLSDYSLSSNFVVNDRINMYGDVKTMRHGVISISNDFYDTIGKNHQSQISTPLAEAVGGFLILQNFLDNLIVSATFLLLMLSMLLIYSLMIGDVEEKTYEFGMLRALGFKKSWLIILLTFEAIIFAIPGLALGLISSYLLNSLVAVLIFSSTQLVSSYQLYYSAIILGVCLGILVPLISNVLPIQRALSKTLRDSLDLYHRTIDDITVNVIKLEKMGLSVDQLAIAVLLIGMGFVCYYLAPQAFIFQNIKLFLAIINIILIIMIIGFTLIANLFQRPFQRSLVHLFLFIYKRDSNLKPIILKNLQGHDRRNFKTTLMYTIALAFLIFAGTGFKLQSVVIEDILRSTIGANMAVFSTDKFGLDEYQLRQYIAQQEQLDKTLIRNISFVTFFMTDITGMSKAKISPLSNFPQRTVILVGVEENLLQSVDQRYYIPNEYDKEVTYPLLESGQKDGVHGLYSREGNVDLPVDGDIYGIQSNSKQRQSFAVQVSPNLYQQGVTDREINLILPQGYKYEVSMNINTPAIMVIGQKSFRTKLRHMATKVPGFLFSGYRQIANKGNGFLSMEDYSYILDQYYGSQISNNTFDPAEVQAAAFFKGLPKNLTYNLPKDSLYISFARTTTYNERVDFANGLRNFFRDENTMLFDVISLVEDAQTTFNFIDLFYVIVALISTTLSFFLLLVSFVSNVRENSWEFGVLRAVGLNKLQITRVYIYEAMALIIASGLIGTVVGIVVAICITLQIVMFTELPFTFIFPTNMFVITFIGGFLTAFFGSYFAVRDIRDRSISTILKGLF